MKLLSAPPNLFLPQLSPPKLGIQKSGHFSPSLLSGGFSVKNKAALEFLYTSDHTGKRFFRWVLLMLWGLQNPLEGLLKPRVLDLTPRDANLVRNVFAFLTRSQAMLMLLVGKSHLEIHSSRAYYAQEWKRWVIEYVHIQPHDGTLIFLSISSARERSAFHILTNILCCQRCYGYQCKGYEVLAHCGFWVTGIYLQVATTCSLSQPHGKCL